MKSERKAEYIKQWREAQERWLRDHGFEDQKHGHWLRDRILVEIHDDSCTARADGGSGSGYTAKNALHYLHALLEQRARKAKDGARRVTAALHAKDV